MIRFFIHRIVFLGGLFIFSSCSFTNGERGSEIEGSILREDFQVLRKTLEEAHPGLYWYADKLSLDRYFDSTYALIEHDMSNIEFFKLLLPVVARIRCVHTNLRLSRNATAASAGIHRLLPFNFFCMDDKLYISKAFGGGHEGAEIIAINNTTPRQILKTLLNSLPADGYNETFKYHLLSTGAFREGYALYFGQPDSFVIKAIDTGSLNPVSFTVRAITPQQLHVTKKPAISPPLLVHVDSSLSTVYLAVNTFETGTKKFTDTLSAIFKAIKKQGAKHLIIDLRQNEGGANDNVSTLFSFIAFSPFLHLKRAEMNKPRFTHLRFFDNREAFENLHGVTDSTGKYLMNYRYAGTSFKKPADGEVFTGSVVVLTSGNTTSAAAEFAAIAHYLGRAKIVGEETGGCYYGATGGSFINLVLPGSRLEVRIPMIRIFTAVGEDYLRQPKGRGTIPDYEVAPGIKDILQGKDVQLEMAENLHKPA